MEHKENNPNPNAWIKKFEKELTVLGVKRGNFLHKGSTYLYIPGNKKQSQGPLESSDENNN